jgi:hypothetical protein
VISKTDFLAELIARIRLQTDDLKAELQSIDAEIANETKSSAGDKFETSREMMSQSRQGIASRIDICKEQLYFLSELEANSSSNEVSAGKLVETNEGYFFFGLALGNLSFNQEQVVALSFQSPLGRAFLKKKVGDKVEFRGRTFTILNCW